MNERIICTLVHNLYNCRLFVLSNIICTIADYLCNCGLLDLILFLCRNLQIPGGFVDNL